MSERITPEGQQPELAATGSEPLEIDLLRQVANMIESEDNSKWSSAHDAALMQLIRGAIRDHRQATLEFEPATNPTNEGITPADPDLTSMAANDRRYRWLATRLLAADFDWQGETVLVFRWPKNVPVGGTCDQNVDAAMATESSAQVTVGQQPRIPHPTTENLLAAIYSVARSIGPTCVNNMEHALYKSMAQTPGGGQ